MNRQTDMPTLSLVKVATALKTNGHLTNFYLWTRIQQGKLKFTHDKAM
jgi:hypothetical protein